MPEATETPWPPDRVIALCDGLGLTFKELAQEIGINFRTVQRWTRPPGSRTYRKPSSLACRLLDEIARDPE